jgi:hypothetical protein
VSRYNQRSSLISVLRGADHGSDFVVSRFCAFWIVSMTVALGIPVFLEIFPNVSPGSCLPTR